MKESRIIIFFLYFIKNIIHSEIIIIPFDTINLYKNNFSKNKQKKKLENNYLSEIFSNELYSNISLGTPKQTVKTIINMEKKVFAIYEEAFNSELSLTFKKESNETSFYQMNNAKGYKSNDNFYLSSFKSTEKFIQNDFKINNFYTYKIDFILLKRNNQKEYNEDLNKNMKYNIGDSESPLLNKYGIIGLEQNVYYSKENTNFINSLKQLNVLYSDSFTFLFNNKENNANEFYNNDNKGYILFGEQVSDKDNYNFINVRSESIKFKNYWNLQFKKVFCNYKTYVREELFSSSIKEFSINTAQIIANLPYIYAEKEYKSFINNFFFMDLVTKNICEYKNISINEDYGTYVCDRESSLFKEYFNKKFPDIEFFHLGFNTTFILSKNDLFTFNKNDKKDKKIYFLIIFSNLKPKYYHPEASMFEEKQRWKLGIPFLKKYQLYFNMEKNTIGYKKEKELTPLNKNGNEEKEKEKSEKLEKDEKNVKEIVEIIEESKIKIPNYIKFFLIILGICFIFLMGMVSHKKLIKIPRKLKANELEDNFEYQSQDRIESNFKQNFYDINNTINKKEEKLLELRTTLNS